MYLHTYICTYITTYLHKFELHDSLYARFIVCDLGGRSHGFMKIQKDRERVVVRLPRVIDVATTKLSRKTN